MALDPEYYEKAQNGARFHLQVELLNIAVLEAQRKGSKFGTAQVRSRVARIFRGGDDLRLGVHLSFTVYAMPDNLPIMKMPIGPVHCMIYEKLRAARFMEVFLNGTPAECHVADFQSGMKLLVAPTDTPS